MEQHKIENSQIKSIEKQPKYAEPDATNDEKRIEAERLVKLMLASHPGLKHVLPHSSLSSVSDGVEKYFIAKKD